ncbi:hypothetical protein AND_003660 [Anopheles darlingi]|uniref:Uncharacterized protein n=1 Tax=Anopheles darlingi TaxID=43151 RepID=W5JMQ2_ANODA|nr:hypothetical protein AND_003660 [Anopheles darlingi]
MADNGKDASSDESSSSDECTLHIESGSAPSSDSGEPSAGVRCRCNQATFYRFDLGRHGTIRRFSTAGGFYWQLGIANCLGRCYKPATAPSSLSIDIDIHRYDIQNRKLIFPIIGTLDDDPDRKPFLIGMQEYTQTGTPYNGEDLLKYIVAEVKKLTQKGCPWNGNRLPFKIRQITCNLSMIGYVRGLPPFDTPFGCGSCTAVASIWRGDTRSFPVEFYPQRTNQALPVDMIADIVANPRELLYTGAMKLLLNSWIGNNEHFNGTAWTNHTMWSIDRETQSILVPYELRRRAEQPVRTAPRVADLPSGDWQQYDYGMMLHYYGPVVLTRDRLTPKLYEHFIHLFCAVTICSSKVYRELLPMARYCFEVFIRGCEKQYRAIPNEVHSLRHLIDAIERFGPLRPLSGAHDIHDELLDFLQQRMAHQQGDSVGELLKECIGRMDSYGRPYERPEPVTRTGDTMIRVRDNCYLNCETFEDSWFMTRAGKIVSLYSYTSDNTLTGGEIAEPGTLFTTPMPSSMIHVYAVDKTVEPSGPLKHYGLADVLCKMMVMESGHLLVFIPMLCTMPN